MSWPRLRGQRPAALPFRRGSGKASAAREAGAGYSSGTSSSATMLMILISGLIAGPAVSL